jgi:hypothetical protein
MASAVGSVFMGVLPLPIREGNTKPTPFDGDLIAISMYARMHGEGHLYHCVPAHTSIDEARLHFPLQYFSSL